MNNLTIRLETGKGTEAADIDENEVVDAMDLLLLRKILLGAMWGAINEKNIFKISFFAFYNSFVF